MQDDPQIDDAAVLDHLERSASPGHVTLKDGLLTEFPEARPLRARFAASDSSQTSGPAMQEGTLAQMQAMLSQLERESTGSGPLEEGAELAELRKAVHRTCASLRDGLTRLSGEVGRLAEASRRRSQRNDSRIVRNAIRSAASSPFAMETKPEYGRRTAGSGTGLRPELWPKA